MVRAKQRGIIYMHTPSANYIILQLDKYAMMMDKCFSLLTPSDKMLVKFMSVFI